MLPPSGFLTSTLPNGLTVQHVSAADLQFIYEETFEESAYLRHGVQLRSGDTVIDVGSNIGLFTLAAAQAVGPEGLVVSAEPLPRLHAVQAHNIESHRQWCQQRGFEPAPVRLLQTGVGDGSSANADFTLYTQAAGWSSMIPDDNETEANMGVFLRKSLSNSGAGAGSGVLVWLGRMLARWAPAWLFDLAWRWRVRRMLAAKQVVRCGMATVSDIIETHSLKRVDLLKIDVERAELDVLRGITAGHWRHIRQVAMEAHDDASGRLQEIVRLLRDAAGFSSCITEQTAMLEGSTLWNIYCTRT